MDLLFMWDWTVLISLTFNKGALRLHRHIQKYKKIEPDEKGNWMISNVHAVKSVVI